MDHDPAPAPPPPSSRWSQTQRARVLARFPPQETAPAEKVVRVAMSGRSRTSPPLRRAGRDLRYDPGTAVWTWSRPGPDGRPGPWEPADVGVDPRLVDPVRSGNFVPCPGAPGSRARDRVIVRLAPGGTDSAESVEVDLALAAPVPGGLRVGPAVHHVGWDGPDALLVSRQETGPDGDDRWVVELLRRGAGAPLTLRAFPGDRVAAAVVRDPAGRRPRYLMTEWLDHRSRVYHLAQDDPTGPWRPVPVPSDVRVQLHGDVVVLVPRRAWTPDGTAYGPGDVLVAPVDKILAGVLRPRLLHRTPRPARTQQLVLVRHRVLVVEGDDQGARLLALDPASGSGHELARTGPATTLRASAVDVTDEHAGDACWVETAGPLSPPSLALVDASRPDRREVVASTRPTFAADRFHIRRDRTTSGGAAVEYLVVSPRDAPADGRTPTLLSVYGGFGAHERVDYLDLSGPTWLDRTTADGRRRALVHAFVGRGTPRGTAPWDRLSRSVDELLAVARALADDGLADPRHLGVTGVSHGGLVALDAALRDPTAFAAVTCRSAVLDLLDFPALDGTAWVHEYGDPRDPAHAAAMVGLSPVHAVVPGTVCPPVLLWTSADDDRVSPEHARRAARSLESAGADVLLLETAGAGHDALGSTAAGARGHAVTAAFLDQCLAPGGR